MKEATEQLDSGDGDDDWGSVTVEEDTEQSQSQDEEQPASSQPQHSSYPSPAVSGAQSRQTETAPAASASSDSSHASLDSDATLQSVGSTTATSTSTSKLGHPDKAVASRMALMRLQSDLKALEHDPPEGISASPVDPSNPLVWRACIFGPSDTPWVSHTNLPPTQPKHAPSVSRRSRMVWCDVVCVCWLQEGGVFQLQLVFPKEYPQKAPQVRFLSKLFHPNGQQPHSASPQLCNTSVAAQAWLTSLPSAVVRVVAVSVFADGNICLDILAEKWSPIYTVSSLLSSIQSLLTDPNTASPANPEAARLFANDIKEYRKRVRQCAAKATM